MDPALAVATGIDPGEDPLADPVHVVVLASRLGPVPYELAEVWPVNVRSAGLPAYSRAEWERAGLESPVFPGAGERRTAEERLRGLALETRGPPDISSPRRFPSAYCRAHRTPASRRPAGGGPSP